MSARVLVIQPELTMSKVLKLDEKERRTVSLLIAVIMHDYKRHTMDVITDDGAGEIAKETWATISKLVNIRESYISVDEDLIKELISENVTNKNDAEIFFNEHSEKRPEDSIGYCLALGK